MVNAAVPSPHTVWQRALRQRVAWLDVLPYALVPILFVIGALTFPGYATRQSVISLLILASFLGLASVGQTLAVVLGGVDLSIPAVIGLADVVLVRLYGDGWPFWAAAAVILLIAIAIGAANAVLSLVLRVPTLVITLGTGLIVTGSVLTWNHSALTGTVPTWLTQATSPIGQTGPIPVPAVVLIWALVSLATILFQRTTRLGREMYATGANPVAARLARARTTWIWIVVMAISALSPRSPASSWPVSVARRTPTWATHICSRPSLRSSSEAPRSWVAVGAMGARSPACLLSRS